MKTHKLLTGTEVCWREPRADYSLSLYGWTYAPLKVGDYLLLTPRGGQETRYQLTQFRRECDPDDMWFGEAVFAPREATL